MRALSISLLLVLGVPLIGCASRERTPQDEREVSSAAQQLVEETERLAHTVDRTGRKLAEDPEFRGEAAGRLEKQVQEARRLAQRARTELPEEDGARQSLIEANRETEQAALRLLKHTPRGERRMRGSPLLARTSRRPALGQGRRSTSYAAAVARGTDALMT